MRILVTGHRGHVGAPVAAHLRGLGHEVAGFDRADGDDLLDAAAFASDPWRALVDCSAAARVLGWRPRYTWAGRGAADAGR